MTQPDRIQDALDCIERNRVYTAHLTDRLDALKSQIAATDALLRKTLHPDP